MATTNIQLNDSTVGPLTLEQDKLTVELPYAYVIKTVAGSESTLWHQTGRLYIDKVDIDQAHLLDAEATIETARLQVNQFTYLDMLPEPLESPGYIELKIKLKDHDEELSARGEYVLLEMDGDAKYIRHMT